MLDTFIPLDDCTRICDRRIFFFFRLETLLSLKCYLSLYSKLAGLAFSCLDLSFEISEQPSADPKRDIYRHPEAMREPSVSLSAAKDFYALGIILLENWRMAFA